MKFLKDNLKFFIVFMVAVSLSLVFIESISTLLLKIGGNINYNSISFKSGYFTILTLSLITYFYLINISFIHDKRFTFLVLYIATLYIYLRFIFTNYIEFLWLDDLFVYSDWLLIIAQLHILNMIRVWVRIDQRKDREKKRGVLVKIDSRTDSFFIEDSLFNNGEIANEKILQKLIKTLDDFKPKVAFTIGLNAVWGYGKSSFLKRFENEYRKVNRREIVFWYNIWKNKGANAIIENFFEELKISLSPFSGALSTDIDKYVESILSLSTTELHKIVSNGKEALSENKSLENYYKNINQAIKTIDRQVIVLLDDLDRLEKEEILNSFKLIRTLSDFNNVIFIAGYDRKYLIDTIEKPKENYLDKVFNVEINLLPFDENQISQKLFSEINRLYPEELSGIDKQGFNASFKSLFGDGGKTYPVDYNLELFMGNSCTDYELQYLDFLETFRDIKRFINEFKFNESFLESKDDIIFSEYILLKLLTYKHRYVQDLILNKMDSILSRGRINWVSGEIEEGTSFNYDVWLYNEMAKSKVEQILKEEGYEKNFKIINAALCRLFAKSSLDFYKENQNSISKIYHTDLYIRNDIAAGNITISQIRKAYSEAKLHLLVKDIGDDPLKKEFTIQNELKYFVFKNRIDSIDRFQDVALSLNMFMSEGIHVDDERVLEILNDGLKRFYKNKRKEFIEMIKEVLVICNIGYLDKILSDINVNEKRKEQEEKYTSGIVKYENNFFTAKEIEFLLLSKLKALIEQKYEVETIIRAYHLFVEKITGSQNVIRPILANKILQNEIETKFLEYYETYLFKMISDRADHSEAEVTGYLPNDFLAQIFSSEKAHQELLKNLDDATALEKLKQDGIRNLLSFLKSVRLEDTGQKEKLQKTIKTIEKFISKNYQPLTRKEYDFIWNNNPRRRSANALLINS